MLDRLPGASGPAAEPPGRQPGGSRYRTILSKSRPSEADAREQRRRVKIDGQRTCDFTRPVGGAAANGAGGARAKT
jgi:hypothetical protein